jgi:hypothetical protein
MSKKEQEYINLLREELTDEEFNKYLNETIDIDNFIRSDFENFINLNYKEQKEQLKYLKSFKSKKTNVRRLKNG